MMGAAAPTRNLVAKAELIIMIAVKFCKIIEAVGEILFSLTGEKLFLGVASALSGGVAEGELGADASTITL